ncbi:phosphoprotein associated with glycosphingolipid-enriched microdomains 1 [Ictalurus furcatus]|uniref:phosphoprotein associated with glycosphingolipid-enriched microdomains 1 n=1 Tax=Ictalurus furcatus TaxID=66913 RepID=UPI0023504532|nr:phosphoprotein associated with glycosphingolipid-enriched microdomains 1 [Ictalurus furcatus]XP_053468965.1 phosphoprotein associated with glycosphingolipid-enriched microdomains 1 [Ictalurus furcatus]
MAPALSALWGSGVAGSEISGELAIVSTLTAFWAFLLLTLLLVLCAGCQGHKKATRLPGDHENLMNGVSEKETCSQTADTGSHATDLVASSSFNGPLTSGTVLTDTVDTSPHPSEDMLSIQSEHRSSKCHQDRELPSIPCANSLRDAAEASEECRAGDSTYEVLKDGASHDAVEDSPYETVKELKEACLTNGTLTPDEPPTAKPNGHLSPSPGTPDLCPLADGAEYASIDLKKKSRYSVDAEAQRSAVEQPVEEENPPPIPDKVLDENDNQNITTLQNGELSALYSTVDKPAKEEENEPDYSSIGEIRGIVVESSSSELYATVRDVYPSPPAEQPAENTDQGYETIKIAKSVPDEGQQDNGLLESDYANVGELELNSETSRL